jgi:hypothetical protein
MRGKDICPLGLCFLHTHADGTVHIHEKGNLPHEHKEVNVFKKLWQKIKSWFV